MKAKVLDRPMFKKKGPPIPADKAENVGIMQGFMTALDDIEGDDYEEEEDGAEKMLDRRPDSPEILMNNLRGDMRSVDARVEELADLVGYRAAAETPTEVLALLQPVLAQQGQMGQPPAPPMGGPQGGAPAGPMAAPAGRVGDLAAKAQGPQTTPPPAPAPMPEGGIASLPAAAEQQAPVAMRKGGIVQHFYNGSEEDGVTQVQDTSYMSLPPELLAEARKALVTPSPTLPVPDLARDVPRKAEVYRQILGGGGKELTQAQMLFDIAQGALNVAAGTDAEGRPIRGAISPIGRIAAGMKNVPALIGARAGELQKQERAVSAAALESTEKQINSVLEYNAKVIESNRKRLADVLSKSGLGQVFGKGDWEYRIITEPGALSNWALGKTNEEQTNLIEAALTKLATPRVETRIDPVNKQPYTVTMPTYMPPHVKQAVKVYKDRTGVDFFKNIGADISMGGTVSTGGGKGATGPAPEEMTSSTPPAITVKQGNQQVPYFWQSPTSGNPTLYNLAGKGTGVVNVVGAFIKSLPFGLDQLAGDEGQVSATSFLSQAESQINRGLSTNPRFSDAERKSIESKIKLEPRLIDNPNAYRLRLQSLDDLLLNIRKEESKIGRAHV